MSKWIKSRKEMNFREDYKKNKKATMKKMRENPTEALL